MSGCWEINIRRGVFIDYDDYRGWATIFALRSLVRCLADYATQDCHKWIIGLLDIFNALLRYLQLSNIKYIDNYI